MTTRLLIGTGNLLWGQSLRATLAYLHNYDAMIAGTRQGVLNCFAVGDHRVAVLDTTSRLFDLKFVRRIHLHWPGWPLLVIGDAPHELPSQANCVKFVTTRSSLADLVVAVSSLCCDGSTGDAVNLQRGQSGCRPATTHSRKNPLTARERQILQLIELGRSNKQIAANLHISLHTVKNHVHRILRKMAANNRREAVHLAHSRGLMEPPAPVAAEDVVMGRNP